MTDAEALDLIVQAIKDASQLAADHILSALRQTSVYVDAEDSLPNNIERAIFAVMDRYAQKTTGAIQ